LRYLFHLKFSLNETCDKRQRKKKRKGTRERERERKRKRKTKRKRKRKEKRKRKTGCFYKRRFFLLLAPGSALEKFAATVNPEDKPTKVNWAFSWPSALEICGKTVF